MQAFDIREPNGVSPGPYSYSNRPLLHNAARSFNLESIRRLLRKGTNPNGKNDQGKSAIHVLLSDGFRGRVNQRKVLACLKELVESGCSINERDGNGTGESPLSLAVHNGLESCVQYLVDQGADTTVRTRSFPGNHSLATCIALKYPNVMMSILDASITVDDITTCEPVRLDWRPILQYPPEVSNTQDKGGMQIVQNKQKEASFLYSLLDVPLETRLKYLSHPLITAFFHLKERKMARRIQFLKLVLSILPVFYMVYVYFVYFQSCKPPQLSESILRNGRCDIPLSLHIISYVLFVVVVVYELADVYVMFKVVEGRNWKQWRGWVSRLTMVTMGVTLYPGLSFNEEEYTFTWQYPVAALGIFLSWVMFLVQLELFPKVKIYLEMLMTILWSVIKIVLLFIPLFVAFFMGFNLIYSEAGGLTGFIQMIVDIGSKDYEQMRDSPRNTADFFMGWADVFSVTFVLIISIVFMNFLLGYSISDIHELKHKAKILNLSNKVQNFFIGDVFTAKDDVVPKAEVDTKGWYDFYPSINEDKFDSEFCEKLSDFLTLKYASLLDNDNDSSGAVSTPQQDMGPLHYLYNDAVYTRVR